MKREPQEPPGRNQVQATAVQTFFDFPPLPPANAQITRQVHLTPQRSGTRQGGEQRFLPLLPNETQNLDQGLVEEIFELLGSFSGEDSIKDLFWSILSYDRTRDPVDYSFLPKSLAGLVQSMRVFATSGTFTIVSAHLESSVTGQQLENLCEHLTRSIPQSASFGGARGVTAIGASFFLMLSWPRVFAPSQFLDRPPIGARPAEPWLRSALIPVVPVRIKQLSKRSL